MFLQTKASCRHAKNADDMGGSDYITPENARKRPSAPLTRLMAATIPGNKPVAYARRLRGDQGLCRNQGARI